VSGFSKKWGLALNVTVITLVLAAAKAAFATAGLEFLSPSTLITAFLGGVIFLMGFLLAGTLSDYKESERLPAELATSVKSLDEDFRIFLVHHEKEYGKARRHVKELLSAIATNFRQNVWDQHVVEQRIDAVSNFFVDVVKKNRELPATFFTKLRNEVINVERLTRRVNVIKSTSFIEAGYAIAEILTCLIIIMFLFLRIETVVEGVIIQALVTFILLYMVLLIKDMDDPFENGASFADVDLSPVFDLEKQWTH